MVLSYALAVLAIIVYAVGRFLLNQKIPAHELTELQVGGIRGHLISLVKGFSVLERNYRISFIGAIFLLVSLLCPLTSM